MDTSHDSSLQWELRQSRPFGSAAQEAAISILRTADVVRRVLAAAVEPAGVTLQQYNVLRVLRGSHPEPLPTLEIGDRLIERAPGITRLIDRLEEKGLVRRERSAEDRRLVFCSIAEQGLALLASLDAAVDAADDAAVGDLEADDLRSLTALLARVRQAAVPRDVGIKA